MFTSEFHALCGGDIHKAAQRIDGSGARFTAGELFRVLEAMSIDGASMAATFGAVPLSKQDFLSMNLFQRARMALAAGSVLRQLAKDIDKKAQRMRTLEKAVRQWQ